MSKWIGYQHNSRPNREKSPYERFIGMVSPEPNTGCWLWAGCADKDGYGFIRVNGKNLKAHRFAIEHYKGDVLGDGLACHTCDTPGCVNPDHLYVGTNSSNQLDASRRGRSRGWKPVPRCKTPAAKLTADDVRQIRSRTEDSAADLAIEYGLRPGAIRKIRRGVAWRHIE